MILPVVAYGDPVLKKDCEDFTAEELQNIQELVDNMYETMYNANGVGLAGPQIGIAKRIFVIDSVPMFDEGEESKGVKKVFINAEIIEEWGEEWGMEEGCLSIPGIRGEVFRPDNLKIRYLDEKGQEHIEEYDDMNARVIQHEYDHIEGILFTDLLSPLKKRMIKGKLANISKGKVPHEYKMRFPKA
ncbi:peptide deformylase [Sediminitomix flava]|uniref:Peptide deformylase n=1 Tax=Sediminitomix flava TaxID=379075 RepID=A0A315ZIH5_SEDFL|nr:peptide deformylase [Sediminitomix flava]PWJ44514.1 peptide deformylase [Sediminitomix flava]